MKLKEIQLLLEAQNADQIYERYYSDIDREVFDQIVKADTIDSRVSDDGKIKKVGAGAKWLLKIYREGNLLLEDLYKFDELYSEFKRNKYRLPKDEKDLMKIDSIGTLASIVDQFSQKEKAPDEMSKSEKIKATDLVYDGPKWIVYHPTTYEASNKLGKNPDGTPTKWCTNLPDYYEYYTSGAEAGTLFVIINKEDTWERYQLHLESGQFMDRFDRNARYEIVFTVKELLSVFKNIVDKYLKQSSRPFYMEMEIGKVYMLKRVVNQYGRESEKKQQDRREKIKSLFQEPEYRFSSPGLTESLRISYALYDRTNNSLKGIDEYTDIGIPKEEVMNHFLQNRESIAFDSSAAIALLQPEQIAKILKGTKLFSSYEADQSERAGRNGEQLVDLVKEECYNITDIKSWKLVPALIKEGIDLSSIRGLGSSNNAFRIVMNALAARDISEYDKSMVDNIIANVENKVNIATSSASVLDLYVLHNDAEGADKFIKSMFAELDGNEDTEFIVSNFISGLLHVPSHSAKENRDCYDSVVRSIGQAIVKLNIDEEFVHDIITRFFIHEVYDDAISFIKGYGKKISESVNLRLGRVLSKGVLYYRNISRAAIESVFEVYETKVIANAFEEKTAYNLYEYSYRHEYNLPFLTGKLLDAGLVDIANNLFFGRCWPQKSEYPTTMTVEIENMGKEFVSRGIKITGDSMPYANSWIERGLNIPSPMPAIYFSFVSDPYSAFGIGTMEFILKRTVLEKRWDYFLNDLLSVLHKRNVIKAIPSEKEIQDMRMAYNENFDTAKIEELINKQ